MCIEGYPEKNTPTILAYKDGDIKRQIVTLKEFNGTKTKLQGEFHLLRELSGLLQKGPFTLSWVIRSANDLLRPDLESMLVSLGAIDEKDTRLLRRSDMYDRDNEVKESDDDDDDWD